MNRKSRILERYQRGGAANGGNGVYDREYPSYLEDEYINSNAHSPEDFYSRVIDEVEECRVDISKKDKSYKLWFGKFKGELVHDIDDVNYLTFLSETHRNKNKKLVGQVLLRIDEIYGH